MIKCKSPDLEVDAGKSSEDLEEGEDVLLAGEELEVGLLVDVAAGLAPAEHLVITRDAVSAGLGVDGEDTVPVHFPQLVGNSLGLPAVQITF